MDSIFHGKNCLINECDETFDDSLQNPRNQWEKLLPAFHAWFTKFQARRFKLGVIISRRREAGLVGNEEFHNNATESINKLLKQGTSAKTTILTLKLNFEQETSLMRRNIERSIISKGPIVPKYKRSFETDGDVWHTMNKKQRLEAVGRFWKGPRPILTTSSIRVTPRLAIVGNRNDKSKKKNEKFRMRQNRNRCTSTVHKSNRYMHLQYTRNLRKNDISCCTCKQIISKKSKDNIVAKLLKYNKAKTDATGKFYTLHAHLKCNGSS